MKIPLAVFAALICAGLVSSSGEPGGSAVAPNPVFEKLKTLAGSWVGTASENGKTMPVTVRFKLVSDGSALASWLEEDTPQEMVTMFHPDGPDLVATHYCSAHNQPCLVLVPGGDPDRLVFRFRDGTNLKPGDGHMQQLAVVFDGAPDYHVEEWTYLDHGQELPAARFDFHRKP